MNYSGENVNLSTEQYDRYKEIISQVSDIMPDLTTYFNAQGEAIGFANGQLSVLSEEYEKYIQNQAINFMVNGDEDGYTL